jgi:hypothetical protein
MDDGYVMRITSVKGNAVHARRTYKVLDNKTTIPAVACDEIRYSDIPDVINRIQEMLE